MKETRCYANHQADRQAVMSLALARYNFSTPEIRVLMRCVLGHATSGRTIKRLAKNSGQHFKRGRPRTIPKIHKSAASVLVQITGVGLNDCDGNALHLFDQIRVQFGLTPLQYLNWATQNLRRGKCMMRRCLLCSAPFASMESGDRHCRACRGDRRRLIDENRRSVFL